MACDLPRQIILLILLILVNYNFGDATEIEWEINPDIIAIKPYSHFRCKPLTIYRRIIVQNIGRVPIIVNPGYFFFNKQTIEPTGITYYDREKTWHLNFRNTKGTRAIVYVNKNTKLPVPPVGYDKIRGLEKAFTLGVKKILNIEGGLTVLLNAFWPENKKNVWEELFQILKTFLSKKNNENIWNINISQDIEGIRSRIVDLNSRCTSNNKNGLASIYMKIAEDLVGLENKFIIRKLFKKYVMTNFYILPLYTNVITMKIHFYAIGIAKPETFQLDDDDVKTIQKYTNDIILNSTATNAITYLNQMNKKAIDAIYKTVYPGGLYNVLMLARTHLALHAMEMIPIWRQIVLNPSSTEIPYIDVISYSKFQGKPSANLYQQATPTIVPPTLNPGFYNNKRAKLVYISFYVSTVFYIEPPIIRAMRLKFQNDYISWIGETRDTQVDIFYLKGETIKKLEIDGNKEFFLTYMKITLSNNTTMTIGEQLSTKPTVFELEDHHIVSFYGGSDIRFFQLNNLAVSFARDY